MAIVRHTAGRELTPEKEAALRAQVRETGVGFPIVQRLPGNSLFERNET